MQPRRSRPSSAVVSRFWSSGLVRSCWPSALIIALQILILLICTKRGVVDGHGYMIDPPNRSSVWRLFPGQAPQNYNDNELFCGGFSTQYNGVNNGRCGECGDTWSLPRPRANDEGGTYGRGIISQNYKMGSYVRMSVLITANHMGYFEFRLCTEKQSINQLVTQECLDKNLLRLADGTTRYYLPDSRVGYRDLLVKLPNGVTCEYCVVQWTYVAGNNWGTCSNGTGAVGCGPQESYRNCADVTIRP